ncbi:hypothetical protein K0M31_012418 [Melipona bicolor]|uniref:Uncharacterized protein n=1 Tax=Melipona bicolor TaxID=60889 RepID=A0AA40FKC7_9HYME|nr:hypothetical protein K0M31_012418 [Melipona bicolor]
MATINQLTTFQRQSIARYNTIKIPYYIVQAQYELLNNIKNLKLAYVTSIQRNAKGKHRLLRKVCKNTDNGALTLIVNRHKLFLVDPLAQEEWHKSPTPASFLPSDASAPRYSYGSPSQIQTYPTAMRVQEYPKMKYNTHTVNKKSGFDNELSRVVCVLEKNCSSS